MTLTSCIAYFLLDVSTMPVSGQQHVPSTSHG